MVQVKDSRIQELPGAEQLVGTSACWGLPWEKWEGQCSVGSCTASPGSRRPSKVAGGWWVHLQQVAPASGACRGIAGRQHADGESQEAGRAVKRQHGGGERRAWSDTGDLEAASIAAVCPG